MEGHLNIMSDKKCTWTINGYQPVTYSTSCGNEYESSSGCGDDDDGCGSVDVCMFCGNEIKDDV